MDTEKEGSHSFRVASLIAMFQAEGCSITAAEESVTLAKSNSGTLIFKCGIDYVGSFEIKNDNTRSKTTNKCYVALFICVATKAIHLELVSNLTSEAFIAALQRFIARRWLIDHLYSDNGSNFVGTNRELKAFCKSEEF